MKLKKAKIENFRSIADLNIDLIHGCQALIGINESGKSSILRALQLLDPAAEIKPTDLRIERSNEEQVDSGAVSFHFELEADEITDLELTLAKCCHPRHEVLPLIAGPDGDLTLRGFCQERASGVYRVDVPSGKRASNYWTLPKTYSVLPGWFQNSLESSITVKKTDGDDELIVPPKGFLYQEVGFNISSSIGFIPLTSDAIAVAVGLEVRKVISEKLPKCIFWKYSEQYLLPSSIDVNSFSQNPNSCIPLRSMFELAGYSADELSATLTKAKSHSQHRYMQVLRKVADAATEHIRSVWKDHKTIRIELQPNGDLLVPLITEAHVPLDMASRSDGFKRFVSFLLQISAKVRTNELSNVLLLIDEPEIALHPSGARSLMQELIEIGESNTVVYSTHSIFMVDRTNVDRHLLVQKDDEVTTAKRAEKSKIVDEEVLYAAMGYSIFESLREKNVIFEGWRDKEIFRIVSDSMAKVDKPLKAEIASIGMTFAEGVKDVRHIARFLELASRGCLVISDADAAAVQRRQAYVKLGSWGTWLTLKDILGADVNAITAEDLILRESIIKRANKFRSTVTGLVELESTFFGATESCLAGLKRWLRTADLEAENLDEALENLKKALFEKLKRDEISNDAEKLVTFVRGHKFL